jgi:putative endonuclease
LIDCRSGGIGRHARFRGVCRKTCGFESRLRYLIFSMYYVYAIRSLSRKYIYVGITDNVERRVLEHNTGRNKTTKPYRPFKLLFVESFDTRELARKKEKYLKSGIGKEFLKTLSE